MTQARRGLGSWRPAILMIALISLLLVPLPAQAGLGDLVDDLLDPVEAIPVVGEIVEPIAEDAIDPLVEDVVEPVAGDLVDPVADEVLAPIVTAVVTSPVVEDDATPVLDIELDPVTETIPPVGTAPTTTLLVIASDQEESAGSGMWSGYPGGAFLPDSLDSGGMSALKSTTQLKSIEAALALQTSLLGRNGPEHSDPDDDQSAVENRVEPNWLNGLTNWLRGSADGLLNILALPIRLLELLARALLTAGSGLVAPLSMLLAFSAVLIKDRRLSQGRPNDSRPSSGSR